MTQNIDNAGAELICPECGYDLRGLPIDRCPECGQPFDRESVWRSRIPWAHRASIGVVRAYVRTAWLGMSSIRTFCHEVARPVSFADAQRFRIITVLLASFAPVVIVLGMIQMAGGTVQAYGFGDVSTAGVGFPTAMDFTLPWIAGVLLWPIVPVGIVIFLFLVTGAGSYWFHPRSLNLVQQNRAVALSYYACATLAWTLFPLLALGALAYLENREIFPKRVNQLLIPLLLGLCGAFFYAAWFFVWLNTLRLLRHAASASRYRVLCCAVGLPISWALCGVIAFGVMPWFVGYVYLMIDSMRG